MSSSSLPFHQSFETVRSLDEGFLLFSESFPDHAIRHSVQLPHVEPEVRVGILKATIEQIKVLENIGIKTVRPKPVITEGGFALVCRKVTGEPLDEEIESGNKEAIAAYGKTLVDLTSYYQINLEEPSTPLLDDIVAPCQFTWQNGEVILHDISAVGLARDKSPFTSLNSGQIAHEYNNYSVLFDEFTRHKILKGLKTINHSLNKEQLREDRSKLYLELTVAIAEGSQTEAQKIISDAYYDLF